jgi:uncharacterized damage-inducible protein DinB
MTDAVRWLRMARMREATMKMTTLLEEALEAWDGTRQGVIDEIENLSEKDVKLRPKRKARTAAELAVHIAEVGLMWSGELSRPDGDFRRQPFADFIREYAGALRPATSRRGLVQLLRVSHAQGARSLRQAGELRLLQLIRRFDGKRGTRLAWLNHGIAHEEYHRGQIAMYARLLGRTPALTRLIEGG